MLKDILDSKKCFKLVCAAGNEDVNEVEKLVALYSLAGANFFDLCAKPQIIDAAKRGLERSGIKDERYLCVSMGIKGDPHISKAYIDSSKCTSCALCEDVCLQDAIKNSKVFNERCIGCERCSKVCTAGALILKSENAKIQEVLPDLISKGIDCVELHASGEDDVETLEKWEQINRLFQGITSICVDRSKLGNERLLERIKKMTAMRKPYTTIIQADGIPMSGCDDEYKTTLQAVAAAEIIQNASLPVYLMLSGGTNSKTTKLAQQCAVKANGVAIGSYARRIVKEYIARDDFFTNKKVFDKALKIAEKLVADSIKYLG